MYIVMELCEKDQVLQKYIKDIYNKGRMLDEKTAIIILDNVL